uniref:THH1/TOM1/TOM3 domain-containing protein n=1 Tax=Chromera velia CCMP2878 TaxID=1169474 RepID=A0A0G4H9F2_9ALVE|eukprot:Cvel_25260.t1-p1 / transcript=Cvel_25260.t1 / gene=Cvel_25260 / organism=Chromera_velia_CCMP2878 / gene_product=Calcium-binding protein P, putative / transcript_product=Calcium-binding protein P, putative / location=Cvel_scaffold2835:18956-21898(-) / protein_length=497 / sequence_SO=supercontig / SO=protein_coding / is_pseudo=false
MLSVPALRPLTVLLNVISWAAFFLVAGLTAFWGDVETFRDDSILLIGIMNVFLAATFGCFGLRAMNGLPDDFALRRRDVIVKIYFLCTACPVLFTIRGIYNLWYYFSSELSFYPAWAAPVVFDGGIFLLCEAVPSALIIFVFWHRSPPPRDFDAVQEEIWKHRRDRDLGFFDSNPHTPLNPQYAGALPGHHQRSQQYAGAGGPQGNAYPGSQPGGSEYVPPPPVSMHAQQPGAQFDPMQMGVAGQPPYGYSSYPTGESVQQPGGSSGGIPRVPPVAATPSYYPPVFVPPPSFPEGPPAHMQHQGAMPSHPLRHPTADTSVAYRTEYPQQGTHQKQQPDLDPTPEGRTSTLSPTHPTFPAQPSGRPTDPAVPPQAPLQEPTEPAAAVHRAASRDAPGPSSSSRAPLPAHQRQMRHPDGEGETFPEGLAPPEATATVGVEGAYDSPHGLPTEAVLATQVKKKKKRKGKKGSRQRETGGENDEGQQEEREEGDRKEHGAD